MVLENHQQEVALLNRTFISLLNPMAAVDCIDIASVIIWIDIACSCSQIMDAQHTSRQQSTLYRIYLRSNKELPLTP